jgi:carbon monoxide dehydrogenase subunit G
MIAVHESFSVPSDPRLVWQVVSDPSAVVSCVPGASLGERYEDGSLDASVTVKFGPVKVMFHARVTLELDDAARVGHVTARGKDNQGGTRVTSTMTFVVMDQGRSESTVMIDGEAEISGKLAAVIESGASIVVDRMASEFAANLAKRCTDVTAAASARQLLETEGDAV